MKKILFFLTLIFGFAFYQSAFASIILSPPKFEFDTDPGKTISGIIKITNGGNSKMVLDSDVQDFIAGGETGQPSFVNPDENNSSISLGNWITVNNGEKVEVEVGEKKEIPFLINVPENAEPGGHYGSIFFFEKAGDGQIAVVRKIGSLVLVKVSGEIREEGKIEEFSVGKKVEESFSSKFLFTDYPVDFSLRFKNTGNIHIKPDGEIKILNTFGSELKSIGVKSLVNDRGVEIGKEIVDYIPVNDKKGNILADSIRKFEVSFNGRAFWYKNEDGGKVVKFDSDSEKSFIDSVFAKIKNTGFYTFKLELNGAKGEKIYEEGNFLFFPFKEIFGLLILFIVILFGIIRYRKYSKDKFEKELQARLEMMRNK